jgi:hypothetical protein
LLLICASPGASRSARSNAAREAGQISPLLLDERKQVQHRRMVAGEALDVDEIGAGGVGLAGREGNARRGQRGC